MSKVEGTKLAAPVGHLPNAQRSEAMVVFAVSTSSRTVSSECPVLVSAVR